MPPATEPVAESALAADAGASLAAVTALADRITSSVDSVMAGRTDAIEIAVACLLSGGHLLIEDVPGVGKTLLAQALARSLGGTFRRIQGTPDLLPGDVTGSMVPNGSHVDLRFRPGPIFANVVVFDELNRTSPRTQSALLETAEESTVSVDTETRPLPAPFLLIATQNPFETIGTYRLGEGTLDRFAAVVVPGQVAAADEVEVLTGRAGRGRLHEVGAVTDPAELMAARRVVAAVAIDDRVARYVVDLLRSTRAHPQVRLGASTRAGVALVGLARARAVASGRAYVVADDVVAVAPAALAHRILTHDGLGSVHVGREVVDECLGRVPVPGV